MKIIKILVIISIFSVFSTSSFSETRDCSMYDSETIMGSYDKWRCKKGKEPRKKFNLGQKLKNLNPLSKN